MSSFFNKKTACRRWHQWYGWSIGSVGSISAHAAFAGSSAYSMVKVRLDALTRNLAIELAHSGIRVNAVS